MKKYLIFDLDGTLIQSQHNIEKLISDFLTTKYPQLDPEYVRYVFSTTAGMPLKKQLEILFPSFSEEEINQLSQQIYNQLKQIKAKFFPQVPSMLQNLHSQGYKLFLTT